MVPAVEFVNRRQEALGLRARASGALFRGWGHWIAGRADARRRGLAGGEGFEPPVDLRLRQFSRLLP